MIAPWTKHGVTLVAPEFQEGDWPGGTVMNLQRARKPYRCTTTRDGRRFRDGGPLPSDHADIRPGDLYVSDRSDCTPGPWNEAPARYCIACARAAGLVE